MKLQHVTIDFVAVLTYFFVCFVFYFTFSYDDSIEFLLTWRHEYLTLLKCKHYENVLCHPSCVKLRSISLSYRKMLGVTNEWVKEREREGGLREKSKQNYEHTTEKMKNKSTKFFLTPLTFANIQFNLIAYCIDKTSFLRFDLWMLLRLLLYFLMVLLLNGG